MSNFRQGWLPFIEQALRRRFATAAQGVLAASAVQPADLTGLATAAQGEKADTAVQPAAIAQLANIDVRQAIQDAPLDSNGYADFLQASGLTLSGKDFSAQSPLILAVSGMPEEGGRPRDWVFKITSNPTWPNSTDNATNYHFIRNDGSGGLTYLTRTLAPSYGIVLPSSPSTGQFHYDIRHLGPPKVYNGSEWENQLEICVGESVASGGSISSVISYAVLGCWSGGTTISVDETYNFAHNLGTHLFSVGGQLNNISGSNNVSVLPNGSGGYRFLGGLRWGGVYAGTEIRTFSNTLTILSADSGIYLGWGEGTGNGWLFTGANLEIQVARNF
jgi:hypothetical protein